MSRVKVLTLREVLVGLGMEEDGITITIAGVDTIPTIEDTIKLIGGDFFIMV